MREEQDRQRDSKNKRESVTERKRDKGERKKKFGSPWETDHVIDRMIILQTKDKTEPQKDRRQQN